MTLAAHTNLDQWISEFPRLREFILARSHFFDRFPPQPGREVDDQQWTRIVDQIRRPE